MQRVTITIDDELDAELDRFMKTRGYDNRSEAIRDLARSGLQQAAMEISGPRPCVAALVYVYDHVRANCPSVSHAISTNTATWHRRRCTCTSMTRVAWKSPY
jgi:nickel-responsive transcriptional regulator NikR